MRVHSIVLASLLAFSQAAGAAETVHLFLQANGVIVQGDSTIASLGRENTIECFSFESGAILKRNAGVLTPHVSDVVCRKAIDKSTPRLLAALAGKQTITLEARFFRASPNGDGTTEQHYSVQGQNGMVVEVVQVSPDSTQPASAGLPAMEEVTFRFPSLTYVYGGAAASVP